MKIKHIFAICGMAAALFCGMNSVSAQDNNGGGGGGGGGGFGGGRRFDPGQMQQDFMNFARNYMNFTNDDDWNAVQPLVQKVVEARRDEASSMGNGIRLMMQARRNENGDDQNGGRNDQNGGRRFRGGFFGGQPSPEYTALQNAIDQNAPPAQVKDLLDRYKAAEKAKQDKLKEAQDSLRAVLSVKQEAQATLLGLLD